MNSSDVVFFLVPVGYPFWAFISSGERKITFSECGEEVGLVAVEIALDGKGWEALG